MVKKKSIRYLPRKKIVFEKYLSLNDFTSKVRVKISPHLVRGHLRNLPTYWGASEKAKEAALEEALAEDWYRESVAETGVAIVRAKQAAEAEVLAECLAHARAWEARIQRAKAMVRAKRLAEAEASARARAEVEGLQGPTPVS